MRRFRRTTLITVGCLSVLAGLGLGRRVQFLPPEWILVFWPIALLLKKRSMLSLFIVILLGLGLGLWRGSIYTQKLNELSNLYDDEISLQVTATSDSVYSYNSQLEFTANKVKLLPSGQTLAGTIRITGFGVNMVYRGDILKINGVLHPSRGSTQMRLSYAQIEKIAISHNWYADLSRRFSAGMQNALPEPMASFGLGLLVGQRSTMPDNIISALTAVGLVHIVAVSGYNLTILVRGVQRLRLRSKYQQLALSLILIGLFISITGFSASIVRAALVSGLSLWAWFYGLRIKPAVLISFAAALTALINPFYVWGDMSWYLSFLAFFGVMIIAPVIQSRLFTREPKLLTLVLMETLSAELMTLPIIMLSFNQLSIVGLAANLLIVPLVPIAMLLAAIAGSAGMIIPQLAGWLAWPANLLMTYMLDIVHLMSSIPSALVRTSIGTTYMIGLYAFLLVAVAAMHHRNQKLPAKAGINTLNVVK